MYQIMEQRLDAGASVGPSLRRTASGVFFGRPGGRCSARHDDSRQVAGVQDVEQSQENVMARARPPPENLYFSCRFGRIFGRPGGGGAALIRGAQLRY